MVSQLSYFKMPLLCQTVERFTIERVNKSGAVFDSTKLRYVLHFALYRSIQCVVSHGYPIGYTYFCFRSP
jgi:hypothetical protein